MEDCVKVDIDQRWNLHRKKKNGKENYREINHMVEDNKFDWVIFFVMSAYLPNINSLGMIRRVAFHFQHFSEKLLSQDMAWKEEK